MFYLSVCSFMLSAFYICFLVCLTWKNVFAFMLDCFCVNELCVLILFFFVSQSGDALIWSYHILWCQDQSSQASAVSWFLRSMHIKKLWCFFFKWWLKNSKLLERLCIEWPILYIKMQKRTRKSERNFWKWGRLLFTPWLISICQYMLATIGSYSNAINIIRNLKSYRSGGLHFSGVLLRECLNWFVPTCFESV